MSVINGRKEWKARHVCYSEERRQDVDEREMRREEKRGDRMVTRGRGEERRQDGDEKERRTLYQ